MIRALSIALFAALALFVASVDALPLARIHAQIRDRQRAHGHARLRVGASPVIAAGTIDARVVAGTVLTCAAESAAAPASIHNVVDVAADRLSLRVGASAAGALPTFDAAALARCTFEPPEVGAVDDVKAAPAHAQAAAVVAAAAKPPVGDEKKSEGMCYIRMLSPDKPFAAETRMAATIFASYGHLMGPADLKVFKYSSSKGGKIPATEKLDEWMAACAAADKPVVWNFHNSQSAVHAFKEFIGDKLFKKYSADPKLVPRIVVLHCQPFDDARGYFKPAETKKAAFARFLAERVFVPPGICKQLTNVLLLDNQVSLLAHHPLDREHALMKKKLALYEGTFESSGKGIADAAAVSPQIFAASQEIAAEEKKSAKPQGDGVAVAKALEVFFPEVLKGRFLPKPNPEGLKWLAAALPKD